MVNIPNKLSPVTQFEKFRNTLSTTPEGKALLQNTEFENLHYPNIVEYCEKYNEIVDMMLTLEEEK